MALMPLILMGDWCSEDITDTVIQRKYGKDTEASNHVFSYARFSPLQGKNHFFLSRGGLSLDRGPFNG